MLKVFIIIVHCSDEVYLRSIIILNPKPCFIEQIFQLILHCH